MSIIYSNKDLIDPNSGEVVGRIRPLLYVSGPMFSQGNLITNIRRAANVGFQAFNRGWAPIVPHLDILSQLITGYTEAEGYLETDLSIVVKCDALLLTLQEFDAYTKKGDKTGTMREVELAESLGIPIYMNITTLPYVKDLA